MEKDFRQCYKIKLNVFETNDESIRGISFVRRLINSTALLNRKKNHFLEVFGSFTRFQKNFQVNVYQNIIEIHFHFLQKKLQRTKQSFLKKQMTKISFTKQPKKTQRNIQ